FVMSAANPIPPPQATKPCPRIPIFISCEIRFSMPTIYLTAARRIFEAQSRQLYANMGEHAFLDNDFFNSWHKSRHEIPGALNEARL
ncbi:MAG TPA: hypothetical protein VIL90_01525, partial [Puia sp.]